MSGKKFVEVLSRLGYPGSSELDGGSFDWIFEFDVVVPFLDWFCEAVQADNRLDPKDDEEFLVLEKSEGVLDGEQLEKVLQGLTDCEEQMSEDQLSQEVEQLEDDLRNYQFRKHLLIQQTKRLSQQKSTLMSRLSSLELLESEFKTQNMLELDKSTANNKKMNSALNRVTAGVSQLSQLYEKKKKETCGVISEPNIAMFLSQIQLDDFFKMEEKFTSELTAFTQKRFFEGIAEMAGAGEGSRFELLEISNPEMLTVRGEEEPALQEACKEIARLQSHYPKNEALHVNAMVEEKTTRVTCDFTEMKIRQLKETPFSRDPSVLSNHLKDAQLTLALVHQHLQSLSEDEIPLLIKDWAKLQVACILCGNYDLKIARQDYFMDNQDQIIEQLLIQKARYEFLTMAFELESRAHRNTCRWLTAVRTSLQDMARLQKERMQMLKDPLLSTNLNERSTLDSQDKFFIRLHQLLDVGESANQPQLFITYQQLVDNSEKLKNDLMTLRDSCLTANISQDDRFCTLEKSLKSCEVSLYSGSSTAGIKPRLTPQPVKDLILQLDDMLKKLESTVLSLLKDVKQKKMLCRDPFVKTERELFVYFFNAPDRLRRVMLDVTNRLQALSV